MKKGFERGEEIAMKAESDTMNKSIAFLFESMISRMPDLRQIPVSKAVKNNKKGCASFIIKNPIDF